MRRGRAALLGCLIALCAALGLAPASATTGTATSGATASPAADTDERDPWVRLDEVPAALSPDDTDVVAVTVLAGDEEIPAGWSVMLTMQPRLLISRTAIANWRSGSLEGAVGQEVARVPLTDPVPAGGQVQVRLPIDPTVKAGLIDPTLYGVHGSAVLLLDDQNDSRRAITRTFLVAGTPTELNQPPRITVLLPLSSESLDPQNGLAERDTALVETAPGGRLDQLRDLGARDGVVPVVDPTVLTLSPDPQAPPTDEADPALAEWQARLAQSLTGREVIGLPYADPDMVALQEARAADLADLAADLGAATLADAGLSVRQDIGIPVSGEAGTGAIGLYSDIGRTGAVVLDADEQPPSSTTRVTPTSRGEVQVRGETVPTLLTDPALSAALAATDDTGPSGGVAAQQRIVADLVVLSGEAPSRERHILVTAPRDLVPTAAGTAAIGELVGGTRTRPGTLAQLLDTDPIERDLPSLSNSQRQAALPAEGIHDVERTLDEAAALASTFTEVDDGVRRSERVAASLVSSRWRADQNLWASARSRFSGWVAEVRRAVHVVPGSTVTQVSRNVRLPVTVENATDGDVAVRIDVQPSSNRLVVTEVVDLAVPAHSRATGYIPVRGVGNGDTSVEIRLLAPSGVQLGDPVVTDVRVRADWETVGTRTIGAIAAVVLLIGLIRSIRRGPRASRARDPLRADQHPAPAGDAQPDGGGAT